jgi:hypothetical protein
MSVFSIRRGGPGGTVHGGGAGSGGARLEAWERGRQGRGARLCSVVFLFSKAALEEPFTAVERG